MKDVQAYNEDGWFYKTELHKFVNSGMTDMSFIDAISGIVNRGKGTYVFFDRFWTHTRLFMIELITITI